jgi:putative spermidine/putrescine transport system ATP-binding protein
MRLAVSNLGKSFQGIPVLRDVSFEAEHGELVSIIGPSGVGKTTLLHIIAGLERADRGTVATDRPITREAPAILVFQDYVLFPNMTVFENVAFGLRARRLPRAQTRERVMAMLGYFHLEDRARAYPAQLSGGQRQRVALARAMVVEPALLLLDEPFANLDRNLKMETALFIRATQREFSTTTVSVTHDLEEALAMSDRIGIMLDGRLRQYASPREVYLRPADEETARFLGPVNRVEPALAALLGLPAETALLRPESLCLSPDDDGPGRIESVHFAGHYISYQVSLHGTVLTVYSLAPAGEPGRRVRVRLCAPGARLGESFARDTPPTPRS